MIPRIRANGPKWQIGAKAQSRKHPTADRPQETPAANGPTNLEILSKEVTAARDIVLVLAIACVCGGFLVEAIYFSALGITELDLPSIRQLIVGGVFLLYLATIVGPLALLIREYRAAKAHTPWTTVALYIKSSLLSYFAIAVFVSLLSTLSATQSATIRLLSSPPSVTPWQFPSYVWSRLAQMGWGRVTLIAEIVLIIHAVAIILERRRKVQPQKQSAPHPGRQSFRQLVHLLTAYAVSAILVIAWLAFATQNSSSSSTPSNVTSLHTSGPFDSFFLHSTIVYALVSAFLTSTWMTSARSAAPKDDNSDPSLRTSSIVVVMCMLAGLVVPDYALSVFPALPRNIGGGRPTPVMLQLNAEAQGLHPELVNARCYLVDETQSRIVLLLDDDPKKPAVALGRDSIVSIRYITQ